MRTPAPTTHMAPSCARSPMTAPATDDGLRPIDALAATCADGSTTALGCTPAAGARRARCAHHCVRRAK
jgi:hypothetical protein